MIGEPAKEDGVKLIDAVRLCARPVNESATEINALLACGFTPVHLQTFLSAELRLQMPSHAVKMTTGLFGDLCGTIESISQSAEKLELIFVVAEWSDLDPRLGVRTLGGWRVSQIDDILQFAARRASRLQGAIVTASRLAPAVVCLPTLPLPPIFSTTPGQVGLAEAQLRHIVSSLSAAITAEGSRVRVVSSQILDEVSPLGSRYDMKGDVTIGFPYRIGHASAVAEAIAKLSNSTPKKKGLITDLDDTLWCGILGEDGPEGVAWQFEQHAHLHGLYQQFLSSLASSGVLIGVASKNDRNNVRRVFERTDLLISESEIFPFEVHWSEKSESVGRILKAWNIGDDAVVFVDDSPAELAEVQRVFPELTCIEFSNRDAATMWSLLTRLRELFGKPYVTDEDGMRLRSIRESGAWTEAAGAPSVSEEFWEAAEASVVIRSIQSSDLRSFELMNKTNQFNLNGRRLTEAQWEDFVSDPEASVFSVSYSDRFGALGKIAVLMTRQEEQLVTVTGWVLSCRAFSRRIEYQCIKYLFDTFDASEIVFEFQPTPRNSVLRNFFATVLGEVQEGSIRISRDLFMAKMPRLFHRVEGVELHV